MCFILSLVADGKNEQLAKVLLPDGLVWGASSDLQMEQLLHQLVMVAERGSVSEPVNGASGAKLSAAEQVSGVSGTRERT